LGLHNSINFVIICGTARESEYTGRNNVSES